MATFGIDSDAAVLPIMGLANGTIKCAVKSRFVLHNTCYAYIRIHIYIYIYTILYSVHKSVGGVVVDDNVIVEAEGAMLKPS